MIGAADLRAIRVNVEFVGEDPNDSTLVGYAVCVPQPNREFTDDSSMSLLGIAWGSQPALARKRVGEMIERWMDGVYVSRTTPPCVPGESQK